MAIGTIGQTPKTNDNQPETRTVIGDDFRIYFQNVNGIKSGTTEWEEMVKKMAENKVGVFGFALTNYNWNQTTTKTCINWSKALIRRETGNKINLSLQTSVCTGCLGGIFQPGGTSMGKLELHE